MAENKSPEGPQLDVHKLFLKGATFELPNDVAVFNQDWKPELSVDVDHVAKKLDEENVYEVVLTAKCTVKSGDKNAFFVEVNQGGVFGIVGLDEAQLSHALGAFCPNLLYPYLRETVSDIVQKGGFPQLMLAPINFDMLYEQQQQKAKSSPDLKGVDDKATPTKKSAAKAKTKAKAKKH